MGLDCCLFGLISHKRVQDMWQQCLSLSHRTRAGDLNIVAVGARKRLSVIIPPNVASLWWPTGDASKIAAIFT